MGAVAAAPAWAQARERAVPTADDPWQDDTWHDAARSRETGGGGLGLPIARWIAEAHGGTIEVGDAPGGGAVFTARLAVHEVTRSTAKEADTSRPSV